MSARRYIKRIWQVPKTRGPVEYLATLIVKALRKHGWPADWQVSFYDAHDTFYIIHKDLRHDGPPDFCEAVSIACRVLARQHNIDVTESGGVVTFNRPYRVTIPGGHFKEIPQ